MGSKRRSWSIPEDLRQHIWNVMEEFAFESEDQALRYILRRDFKQNPSKGRTNVNQADTKVHRPDTKV